MPNGQTADMQLRDILKNLADVLQQQAKEAAALDAAVAGIRPSEFSGGLQQADLIRQTTDDLAQFAGALALAVPDVRVEVSSVFADLRLGAISASLRGDAAPEPGPGGQVQLF